MLRKRTCIVSIVKASRTFLKSHAERAVSLVRNTATEKVDRLISCILTNLVTCASANLKNSEELTEILKSVDLSMVSKNATFISLHVISLYPSNPLEFGLNCISELADRNWNEIWNEMG